MEVVNEIPIPPEELYDVTVYENAVMSRYYDRTGKDRLVPSRFRPAKETRSPRSIGVFSLPAGDALQEGNRVDVLQSAKLAGNPGAAGEWPTPFPRR